MTPEIRTLITWIAKNAWRESICEYPDPAEHVPMVDLLDCIAETFRIPKEEIGAIVNAAENR